MTQEDNQQMPELKWYQIKALEEYPMPKYIQTLEMRTDDIVIKKQDAYIKGLLQSTSGKCREALSELVRLKAYKDTIGKDEHYESRQPIAWQNAAHALATLDSREDQDEADFTLWVVVNKWEYREDNHLWFNNYIGEFSDLLLTHSELKSKFIISKK